METRRALSSLASVSLFVLATGCGAPDGAGPALGPQRSALVVPADARIGAPAIVGESPQITQPRVASNQGRLLYIDVGAPTGTVDKSGSGSAPPPSGGTPPDGTIGDPGGSSPDPGPVVVGQDPDQTAPPADACREVAVGDPSACADQPALVAAAHAACAANQYRLDRVTVSEQGTCDSLGHLGAVARCCPPNTQAPAARPSWCESHAISLGECLPRASFEAHARAMCQRVGLAVSEPSFEGCDLTGQQAMTLHFGCCGLL